MARIGLTHITAALTSRNYRIYMSGNAVSLVGLWVQRVAVGWLAYDLTGSGAWLGAMVDWLEDFPLGEHQVAVLWLDAERPLVAAQGLAEASERWLAAQGPVSLAAANI